MRPRPSSEPDNYESRTSSQSCPIAVREQDPDQAEMAIPHLFRCPISLDVFTDPVTLCTGQTYDRSNIERWLQLGNLTCPVTMQRLQDPSIVPNHTLRHLIEHWNSLGRRPIDPDLELVALKHDLESHETTSLEDRHRLVHMVQKVRDLSSESPSRCARLIRLGFLPLLLELVFGGAELRRFSRRLVQEALACAIKLLDAAAADPESSGSLSILREDSMLRSFYELFEEGGHSDFVVKSSLCRIIEVICSSPETRDISTLLVKRTSFLHELIVLLYQNDEVSEAGLRAIKSLCSVETNRDALVQTGLLDGLIGHIRESTGGSSSTHLLAMAILEQTLVVKEARGALLDHPNGIKSLVKMVFQVSDLEGSDSAVSCLILLCENSLRAREAAIGSGVLTQLLLLLQSHCSVRTKARARVLLKLLRSKEG